MVATVAERLKNTQYVQTVHEFLRTKGRIYCLTDDAQFIAAMRGILGKDFGQQDALVTAAHPVQMQNLLREDPLAVRLIFVERVLNGMDMASFINKAKQDFLQLRVIVLTQETVRSRVVLLHEAGADSFIVKPISANGIIEKMAFTIKPQNKLSHLLDEARMCVAQGNPKDALNICQKALKIKPDSAAALLALGDAMRALDRMDESLAAYEHASESAEMYLDPLRKLADLHGSLGNTEKQLRYLLRLNRLSPLNLERKLAIAEIYMRMDDLSAAAGIFEEALRLATREGPEYAAWAAAKAAALSAELDPSMCQMYLAKIFAMSNYTLTPEDVSTILRLGQTLCSLGKPREAVVQYRQALRLLPEDPMLHYNAGMASAEAHSFADAQTFLNKALALDPNLAKTDAATAYGIALVFIQGGGKARALECLNMALECDPQYAPAKEALSRMENAAPARART